MFVISGPGGSVMWAVLCICEGACRAPSGSGGASFVPEDPEWAWFTLGLVCVGVIWVVLGCLGRELGCPGGQAVTSSGMIGAWRVLVPQLGCPGGHDSAWHSSAWSGIYHLWGGRCSGVSGGASVSMGVRAGVRASESMRARRRGIVQYGQVYAIRGDRCSGVSGGAEVSLSVRARVGASESVRAVVRASVSASVSASMCVSASLSVNPVVGSSVGQILSLSVSIEVMVGCVVFQWAQASSSSNLRECRGILDSS